MLTKTQLDILKHFTANITGEFSIREVAISLKKPYALTHQATQVLLEEGYLSKSRGISLNYHAHHATLAYIESLRAAEWLAKKAAVKLFIADVVSELKSDYFTLLIFGSAVKKRTYHDVDVLLIVADDHQCENAEKVMHTIAKRSTVPFDIQVITAESVYEMLSKRTQLNVMNEILDNHILLFGAENLYRMVDRARQ